MISNLDIYRTANLLYDEFGEKAIFIAAENADNFLAKGDKDGHAVWKQIVSAVIDLIDDEPSEGESIH